MVLLTWTIEVRDVTVIGGGQAVKHEPAIGSSPELRYRVLTTGASIGALPKKGALGTELNHPNALESEGPGHIPIHRTGIAHHI